PRDRPDQLGQGLRVRAREPGLVAVGRDHEVPVGIRITVEKHEHSFSAVDDQGIVSIPRGRGFTEDAAARFLCHEILVTPGSEEDFRLPRLQRLMSSFSSLPGLKYGIFLAGTATLTPVFGLRPMRAPRSRRRKEPKPR